MRNGKPANKEPAAQDYHMKERQDQDRLSKEASGKESNGPKAEKQTSAQMPLLLAEFLRLCRSLYKLPQEILSGRVLAPWRLERSLRSKPFHRQSLSLRGGDGECTQVRLEGPSSLTSRILNFGRSLKS